MKLNDIYKRVPEIVCPEGCHDCCSPVLLLRSEAIAVGKDESCRHTDWDEHNECEFLTEQGCSVYENRPFTCRIFGTSEFYYESCDKVISGDFLTEKEKDFLMTCYAELVVQTIGEEMPKELSDASAIHDRAKHAVGKLQMKRPLTKK